MIHPSPPRTTEIQRADAIRELIGDTHLLAGWSTADVERVATALLGAPPDEVPWVSRLNADGSPIELAVSIGPEGRSARLIGDPCARVPPGLRPRVARAALRQIAELGAPTLKPVLDEIASIAIPDVEAGRYAAAGVVWLAAAPGCSGMAAYFNAWRPTTALRWDTAFRWLGLQWLPGVTRQAFVRAAERSFPVSLGIEGVSRAAHRRKVYFRLQSAVDLEALGIPSRLAAGGLIAFLQAVTTGSLTLSGLTISLGVAPDGELTDAKIDLCAHCLTHESVGFEQRTVDFAGQVGLNRAHVEAVLSGPRSEIALIGFGVDQQSVRLNVYLKPRLS